MGHRRDDEREADAVNQYLWALIVALALIFVLFCVIERHNFRHFVERPQVAVVAHDEPIPPMVAMQPSPVETPVTDGTNSDALKPSVDTPMPVGGGVDEFHVAADDKPIEALPQATAADEAQAAAEHHHVRRHHHHRHHFVDRRHVDYDLPPEIISPPLVSLAPVLRQFQMGAAAGVLTLPVSH